MHVLPCNLVVFELGQQASIGFILARDYSWYRPRTGRGYAIIGTYTTNVPPALDSDFPNHTYAQAALVAPLQAGCTYRVTFYARLAWGREFNGFSWPPIATDNLGAYFSAQPFIQSQAAPILLAQPQVSSPAGVLITDTLNYTRVSGTFVAQGTERYLTLGNFRPDAQTTTRQLWANSRWGGSARYAIDDVSVEAVPPAGLALTLGPDQWLGACPAAAPATLTAPAGFNSYTWNTGQTGRSIPVSQPGRYTVTADFGCGTVRDSLTVRRYDPVLTPLLGLAPVALCPGQPQAVAARPGFVDYRWADGPTGPSRLLAAPGRYRLTARTADGCLVRDSVLVVAVAPPALPRLPADTVVCAEDLPVRLALPPAPAGLRYQWSAPGATATALPVSAAGTYTLTVDNGCLSRTTTVRVRVRNCAGLDSIPNIITPNGDGRNERFQVRSPSARTLALRVFNRWGREVYRTDDYRNEWPQTPPPAGLYYYWLTDIRYQKSYRGWLEVRP